MRRKITDKLLAWKENKRKTCLLIRGARQVGKTYSVTEFVSENYAHHLCIDLSKNERARSAFDGDPSVDDIIMRLSIIFSDFRFVPGETAIFLDEIQSCPNARTSLKSFAQDGRYDVIASGSLIGIRMSDVGDYPVGYETRLTMYPMDFEEFLWANEMSENVLAHIRDCIRTRTPFDTEVLKNINQWMRWYMITGGMPQAVGTFVREKKFDGVRQVHSDIIQDYMDDISKHCDENQRNRVERIFESVSAQLAKQKVRFVYSEVRKEIGYDVGSEYYGYSRNWLKQAGLTLECIAVSEPHMPLAERMDDTRFKLYFNDTGLLTSMYESEVQYEILTGNTEVNRGAVMENLVAQMLASQGRSLLYYYRPKSLEVSEDNDVVTVNPIELDFVTVVEGHVAAIEVKSGRKSRGRSLLRAMEDFGVRGINLGNWNIQIDENGVLHLPIFAAAFMDSIDPPRDMSVDASSVDRLNTMFG